MGCADCAHWVTHRCFDRNRGPSENRFAPCDQSGTGHGECDRSDADGALMCTGADGVRAQLYTLPTFGCVEFVPAPAGWDHHRLHRRVDCDHGRSNWVVDDAAHAEGTV